MSATPEWAGLRTLVTFHSGGLSGPLFSLKSSLEWLSGAGPVDVLLPETGAAESHLSGVGKVSELGYRPLTMPRSPTQLWSTLRQFTLDVRRFVHAMRTTEPDVVVIVTTRLPAALVAARLTRTSSILYVAELPGPRDRSGAVQRASWHLAVRLADGLVCCSEAVAREVPTSRTRSCVIAPAAIDLARIENGDAIHFRSRFSVAPASLCIAVVGNITRGRGQDVMLRALPHILSELPGTVCVFAGDLHEPTLDAEYQDHLRRLVHDLQIQEAVRWCGPVDPVGDVYAAADVVVNPARNMESLGLVALEALAARRPVVSASSGAIAEVLHDEVDALLVPPEDAHALAASVVRLVRDPALAARLVEAGSRRAKVESNPARSPAAFAEAVKAIYP